MEITFEGQKIILDHRKAVFIKSNKTLVLADLHVGKAEHFRKNGLSLPSYGFVEDIKRFHQLIETYLPDRVLLLGDLYHSVVNEEFAFWDKELDQYKTIEFILVLGNHDSAAQKNNPFMDRFNVCYELEENGFYYTHEPRNREGMVNWCGHMHPGVVLKGAGKQRLKMPCFSFSVNQVILPAFSEMCGLGIISPQPQDNIYVCSPNEVIKV